MAGPADGLIDAAGFVEVLSERALRVAWDQLRWRDLATEYRLQQRIAELWDEAPGARVLQRILELHGGVKPESEGERGLGRVMGCFEPAAEPQVWVAPNRRTDHYFRTVRMGFEYLGAVDHGHVAGRIADDERDAELRAEGVRLHHVTSRDLREPRVLLANVAGMLTVRAHELGARPPEPRWSRSPRVGSVFGGRAWGATLPDHD